MFKKIVVLIMLGCFSTGCAIFYPSFRSVGRFEGRLVYSCNAVLDDGQHKKGDGVPNVPLVISFTVTKEDEDFLSGNNQSILKRYRYYTFTNDKGQFKIPRITKLYLGQSYWFLFYTKIYMDRWQLLTFLYPYKIIEIVDTNRNIPYVMSNTVEKIKPLTKEFGGWGPLAEHIRQSHEQYYDPILELLEELQNEGIPLNEGDDQKLDDFSFQYRNPRRGKNAPKK